MMNKVTSLGYSGTAWDTENNLFNPTTGAVLDWNQLEAVLGNSEYPPISSVSSVPASSAPVNFSSKSAGVAVRLPDVRLPCKRLPVR